MTELRHRYSILEWRMPLRTETTKSIPKGIHTTRRKKNMSDLSRMHPEVKRELDNGKAYLPIPEGQKFPPPPGTTGNRPMATNDEIRALWVGVSGSSNLAWWLPDNVIVPDVDHGYNGKTGADTLKALEEDLGELPPTWSTTRRGADSKSRKMFYIVPEGFKWHAKAGKDIDIIQRSHRYVIVAPSVVDGLAEQWYRPDGTPSDRAPLIEELAALPEKWIEHLKKETFSPQNAPAEDLSWPEADVWLSKVAPSWEDETGPIFRSVLEDEELFSDNGHDTMVSKQKHFLRLAVVDGQPGLKQAMTELAQLFIEEVGDRRGQGVAEWEFESALYGEVNNLRGDIEHKKAVPFMVNYNPALLEGFTSLTGATVAAKAHAELLEFARRALCDFAAEDAVGEILAYILPNALAVKEAGKDTVIYDDYTADDYLKDDLRSVLKHQVRGLLSEIRPTEEEDDDYLKAGVNAALKFVGQHRNHSAVVAALAVALGEQNRCVDRAEFDSQPELLGLSNRQVIDLRKATPTAGVGDCVRDRVTGEMVTHKLSIEVAEAVAELEHRRTAYPEGKRETMAEIFLKTAFPDPETRRWAQKIWGYAAFGSMSSENRNLPVFMGGTSTGKSTLYSLMRAVGGDYIGDIGIESLTMPDDAPNARLFQSIRKRWLVLPELEVSQRAASARLKALTSTEGVTATAKHSNHPVHSNTITPIIMTNEAPSMVADPAIRKRLIVVPMETPSEVLEAVLPARRKAGVPRLDVYGNETDRPWFEDPENKAFMLEWVIQGYAMALEEGLSHDEFTDEMVEATERFIGEADPVQGWISENLDFSDPEALTLGTELTRDFKNYNDGATAPSGRDLKKLMIQSGAEYVRKNGTYYRGVKIIDGVTYPGSYVDTPADRAAAKS